MESWAQPGLGPAMPAVAGLELFMAPTLLIVDDQPLMAEFIASVADDAGWRVELAANADEFEARVQSAEPDLIAMDLAMPDRDGVELLRYLSSINYAGNLVIVSACDQPVVESAASLAREHGLAVIGYLQKPVTAETFRSLLDQMVAMIPGSAFDRGHQ